MIRIHLAQETIDKIKKIYWEDIKSKNWDEIVNIINFLYGQNFSNTADLFSESRNPSKEKVKNLCLTYGKENLKAKIREYETAIENDSRATSVPVNDIKGQILNAGTNMGFGHIYKNFSDRNAAIKILKLTEMQVCPYCNRIYTFTTNDNGRKTKPELDLFFPKSIFPYLSLLFNMVPSCSFCNKGKSIGAVTPIRNAILYPYEESFEDKQIKFTLADTDIEYVLAGNDVKVSLFSPDDTQKYIIEEYNSSIKIEMLYNMHNDYIQEIIKKVYIYNDSRIIELLNTFDGLFANEDEILRLLFCNYINETDFGKRPLAKLTRDILEEFEII